MKQLLFALSLTASPLWAECPDAPDITDELDRLIADVKIAPNESAAKVISNDMWALWSKAPDATAQRMLDDGLGRRNSNDFDGAQAAFEQLIDYCPDYAEGYNQRAFILFIRQDYAPALNDLERAIALSPKHIAAIAGKALTLVGLKRDSEAQAVLREALALNPWLPERRFLTQPAPEPETDL